MSDQKEKDLVVIGAGPGGYAAAFLAADLGMTVTMVDPEANPGGVCLYRGCIPSKALLHAAHLLDVSQKARSWGITFQKPDVDIDRLREKTSAIIEKLTQGLGGLSRKRNIETVQGRARFNNSNSVIISQGEKEERALRFKNAIIATGSLPVSIPNLPDNDLRIMDSTAALALESIPETLLVVGGGYIGLELGTVYAALGSQVSVVEMMPGLLWGVDRDLVRILAKKLETTLASIQVNTKVTAAEKSTEGIRCRFSNNEGQVTEQTFERILIAVGRRPNTTNLGLENTAVTIDADGYIITDQQKRTADPAIFAVGDVAGQPMLAHKATHEGRVAAEAIGGSKVIFAPHAIPAVVFTDPEIAWCGLTETEAKANKILYETVRFPWAASGRALTQDLAEGMTKIIVDPETERILGMGIVGNGAGEMIAQGTLAIEMAALVSDVGLTIHPHPTLSETIMEAADVFFGQSTHIYRPKRK